jgi:mannose-6-phosphate isomerase-like protein (cupin superfamily)
MILEEGDGRHRLRRPGGPTGSGSVPVFIIKIDKQNGNAEDFYVGYEVLNAGAMIPLHNHHNSEEVAIFEEGGATVTVGDKRGSTLHRFHSTRNVGVHNQYGRQAHPRVLPVLASRV